MKTGSEYKKDVKKVLDILEHSQKVYTENGITSIFDTEDFDIHPITTCRILHDLVNEFEQLSIKNIYDLVNEEHWLNPPLPGDLDLRPIAELEIKGPAEKIRRLIEAEYGESNNKRAVVLFDIEKGIYLQSQPYKFYTLRYKIKGKPTKRYRLIDKLVKAGSIVSGPKLVSEIGYKTLPLLSQEIKKINQGCRDRADLSDDFILHNKSGGYKINSFYEVLLR